MTTELNNAAMSQHLISGIDQKETIWRMSISVIIYIRA